MDTIFVQTVWRIMEELREANQLETALSGSLDILKDVTESEEGVIWMLDDQSERIIAVSSSGATYYTGISVGLGDGIIGKVVREGASQLVESEFDFGYTLDGSDDVEIRNALIIPLKTPNSTIGCIQLINSPDGFSAETVKVCENASSILALDIEDKGFTFRPFEDREPIVQVRNVVKEFTTTEGYYSIVLNAGQYSVSEVSAPSGYILSSEVIYFELTSDGILKVKNNKGEYVESAVITFYNTPKDNVDVVVPNTGANNYALLIAGVALILGGIAYARKTIKEC